MSKHVNSASRVRNVLKSIPYHQDGAQTLSVWAQTFGIAETNISKQSLLVAERLALLYRELELARSQMVLSNFSAEYYNSAFSSIEQALSAMALGAGWIQVRQHLNEHTFTVLGMCSEFTANEENTVDEEEFEKLRTLVSQLEESLTDSQLPMRLQEVMRHYIELILKALDDYAIVGIRSLREVTRVVAGEMLEVRDEINANASSAEATKMREVWNQIASMADSAIKVDKLIQITTKGWDLIAGIIS